MTNTAFSAIDEANLVLVVVDSGSTKNSEIDKIIKTLNESNQSSKIFLVLNKIDKVSRETVLEKIKALGDMNLFEEIFPISALIGDGVQEMLDIIKNYLPKGEKQFSNKKSMMLDQKIEPKLIKHRFPNQCEMMLLQ